MKVKRYKRVQKYLRFYKNKFGFRSPFQILIDSTFCQKSLQNKVNIGAQIPKYLSEESVKLFTTVCVVEETQRLSEALYGAMVVVKQFAIRTCGHEKSPIAANECLRQLICGTNNSDHYMLATQDSYLSRCVKQSTVCPLIYLKRNTIVMEKPNDSVKELVDKEVEKSSLELEKHEYNVLRQLKKREHLDSESEDKNKKKRRKGPKSPNPLSCKKKKKTTNVTNGSNSNATKESINKSKRKRNRGPKHIKRMFETIETNINKM